MKTVCTVHVLVKRIVLIFGKKTVQLFVRTSYMECYYSHAVLLQPSLKFRFFFFFYSCALVPCVIGLHIAIWQMCSEFRLIKNRAQFSHNITQQYIIINAIQQMSRNFTIRPSNEINGIQQDGENLHPNRKNRWNIQIDRRKKKRKQKQKW